MRFLNTLAAVAPVCGFLAATFVVATPGSVAAQTCPDYTHAAGEVLDYPLDELENGVSIEMLAGGDIDLSSCADVEGYGHFVAAPDYEITLAELPEGYGMMIGVQSECDTMLLVNGPDGTYSFNDDFEGFNPVLGRADGAGTYDIWVGTYDSDICEATLMLGVASGVEFLNEGNADGSWSLSANDGTCPDPSLDGAALSLTAADLSAGHVEAMLAGGDVDIGLCADLPGFGNVITAPDYDLDIDGLEANGQFTIGVASECDTILLVNDPTGEWHYNDDANGSVNPELKLGAGNGRYDVWVGTYGTDICEAELTFKAAGPRLTK